MKNTREIEWQDGPTFLAGPDFRPGWKPAPPWAVLGRLHAVGWPPVALGENAGHRSQTGAALGCRHSRRRSPFCPPSGTPASLAPTVTESSSPRRSLVMGAVESAAAPATDPCSCEPHEASARLVLHDRSPVLPRYSEAIDGEPPAFAPS
jgi:hypothetical protein